MKYGFVPALGTPLDENGQLCKESYANATANPFEITKYDVSAKSGQIFADYDNFEGKTVSIAGRIVSRRIMGKASFTDIQDGSGRIQR